MELTFKIITGLLSLTVPFLLYRIQRQNEELKSIREKLSDKKFKSYTDIFDLFFGLFKKNLNPKGVDKKLVSELMEIQKNFMIYASDDVLHKYIEWKNSTGKFALGHMIPLLEIFPLIRKDMGNKDTTLEPKDILKVLMLSTEDIDAFYQKAKDEYEGKIKLDSEGNPIT
jgi:hypothetical protein